MVYSTRLSQISNSFLKQYDYNNLVKKAINKHIPELEVANNVVPKNYVPLKK
jgi:hypothetical protein